MFRIKSGISNSNVASDMELESATHVMPEDLTPERDQEEIKLSKTLQSHQFVGQKEGWTNLDVIQDTEKVNQIIRNENN